MASTAYPLSRPEVFLVSDGMSGCYDRCLAEHPEMGERFLAMMEPQGRLIFPEELQKRLRWPPGEPVVVTLEADGTVRLAGGSPEASSPEPQAQEWKEGLRASAGMWRDREDLPDLERLRSEWDRDGDQES